MVWQDIVVAVAGLVFAPSLAVSIVKKAKYPLLTSLPTAIALTGITVVYFSYNLYLSVVTTSLTALCWFILALRRNKGG